MPRDADPRMVIFHVFVKAKFMKSIFRHRVSAAVLRIAFPRQTRLMRDQ
jgi:hypothetical protein